MSPGLLHYLAVSGLIFLIGLAGVVVRRNIIVVYMCLELMLAAGVLAMVVFSRFLGQTDGQVFVFFIITVAAAEVAVGLALIVALFRARRTTRLDELNTLRF
ncbi:MAG TPA: NADH-quinone oxidoreductase subunit NuoK [Verrucomicrobiae bacterium]|nr:NADH-quinone oxidoreductase subunit NuoK [Verrucomicrobiae bacterium]